jgi:DNA polymerase-3 subunit gamma/tau
MPHAPNQRQALEMTLIRMLAFQPADTQAAAPAAPAAAPVAAPAPAAPPVQTAAPAAVQQAPAPRPAAPPAAAAPPAPAAPAPRAKAKPAAKAAEPEPERPKLPPAKLKWKPEQWSEIVTSLSVSGMPLQLARNCVLAEVSADKVVLQLDPEYESLAAPRWKERLREKMSDLAEGEVQLTVEVPKALSGGTPAMVEKQAESDRLQSARTAIEEDPIVQEICEKFGGTVSTGSIKPVDDETSE